MALRFTFTWKPNSAEMRQSILLSYWATRAKLVRTVLLLFVLPGFAFGIVQASPLVGLAFGFLFGVLFLGLFPTVLGRQLANKQLAAATTQQIVVDSAGVERTAGGTSLRTAWSGLTRVLELPAAFVLFEGSNPVAGIEKSAIPDAKALADLRAFINSTTKLYARQSTFLAFERRDGEA